jgi:hypothetical protein
MMLRAHPIGTTMGLARVRRKLSCWEMIMLPNIAIKKKLSVNGRPYPVIEAGEGPLVVCLHDFPDNYETWQHKIEPFVGGTADIG